MSIPQFVDGVTELDAVTLNRLVDAGNVANYSATNRHDIREHGGVLDGVTDDSDALDEAIEAASGDNGYVSLPGKCAVSRTVSVRSGVPIVGNGRTTSRLVAIGTDWAEDDAMVVLGHPDDSSDLAFGTRLENLQVDCAAKVDRGVRTDTAQEQCGLHRVAVTGWMEHGFYANATGGGGGQHFTLSDVELYSHPSAVNPGGLYAETIQSMLLSRVTIYATGGASTGHGFEFNNSGVVGIDLHAEYFDNGLLAYNGSRVSILGMGGTHLEEMVNFASNIGYGLAINVGVLSNTISGAYLQDQVNGQYITTPVAYHVCGQSWSNGLRNMGYLTDAGAPTTSHLTETKAWGVYKDTNDSKVYLAYNDGGAIKKMELT